MIPLALLLFGLTFLHMAATSRVEATIHALVAQGFLLFLVILADRALLEPEVFGLLALESLLAKGILIPAFLLYVVRRQGVKRDIEPYFPHFYSLAAMILLFLVGFGVAGWAATAVTGVKPLRFGSAVFAMLAGLFLIMTRRKIISHVVGFVAFENGIFLLTLAGTGELPLAISLGVLLDLFVAVFLFGLISRKIHNTFEDADVAALSELRD